MSTPHLFLEHLLAVLSTLLALLLVARILGQDIRGQVSFGWIVSILLIPYVAIPAYLIFGGRKLRQVAREQSDALYHETVPDNAPPVEKVLVAAGMPPIRGGNRIRFLPNGEEGYEALCSLIEGAEHSIAVMTFILGRDDVGRDIVDRLTRRAREGVRVYLLLDALGCLRTRRRFVAPLRKAGGHVGIFLPMLPLRRKWSTNLRNHRKVAIADERIAFIGGMNIAHEYMGPVHDSKRWLDTGALVEGPVVDDLRMRFARDWRFATDVKLYNDTPDPARMGDAWGWAQCVSSGPDIPSEPMYDGLIAAVYGAKKRVWILTPYFVPDDNLIQALTIQAHIGCEVSIVVPSKSNHPFADLARERHLRMLDSDGVKILLMEGHMFHAKHIVIDDSLAVVGSVNFDIRSMHLNFESALFLYSSPEIEAVASWIHAIKSRCRPYVRQPVSPIRKLAEDLSQLAAPLL